ncbi:MAG: transglutaminase-like domain-containing protein [Lachnospiraceae bacterium]|nr:transglutaminase-like domain-containing protein [Lachnospiraceae bacterium]
MCKRQSNKDIVVYCKIRYLVCLCVMVLTALSLAACSGKKKAETTVTSKASGGVRDNTPLVMVPSYSGADIIGNETVSINISNSKDGYIVVTYKGTADKVKMQLTGNGQVTYTYNLKGGQNEVIPLTADDGTYLITVYENVSEDQYATAFSSEFDVSIQNKYGPYLYPNLYVDFNTDSKVVKLAAELASDATCDLDVVNSVYAYMVENVTYDHDKANNVQSGYIPVVDEILAKKTGICFDYAAVMAAMLRSQRIPTRLEIGYAGDAYHAWISVYTPDTGWINGMIEFDGTTWSLMDPTFAANTKAGDLKKFIGDGSNYSTKYVY